MSLTSKGGQFFDLTAKQSQTLAGKWSTLRDSGRLVAQNMSEAILPALGKLVDVGIQATGAFLKLNDATKGFAGGALVALAGLGPATVALGAIVTLAPKVAAGFAAIRTAAIGLRTVLPTLFGPAGLILAGVTAMGALAAATIKATNALNEYANQGIQVTGLSKEAAGIMESVQALQAARKDFVLKQAQDITDGNKTLEEARAAVQRYDARIQALRDRFAEVVREQAKVKDAAQGTSNIDVNVNVSGLADLQTLSSGLGEVKATLDDIRAVNIGRQDEGAYPQTLTGANLRARVRTGQITTPRGIPTPGAFGATTGRDLEAAAQDRLAQRRVAKLVRTDLEGARSASSDIETNLAQAATDARVLRENANIRAGAQARLGLEAQDAARNANAAAATAIFTPPREAQQAAQDMADAEERLAARRQELALKSFVPLDRAMEQSAIAADRLAASERNILRGRLATQGGAPFSGRAPTAGSSAFGQATNYSSYLEVLRQGGAKQAQVNRETRKTQIDAAEKFRDTVISAGFGFADTLVQGIKTGDVGSIFGGLGGAVGSVLSAVPGFGLAGSIVTGAAGLIGSIFGGAGGQQDQAAQAAELRRTRGVPAVNINATVNQSNTINGSPNAQVEAYLNRQTRDIILQVLQELNIPKTLKQVTAGA